MKKVQKRFGFSRSEIPRLFIKCSRFFSRSILNLLRKNLYFLKSRADLLCLAFLSAASVLFLTCLGNPHQTMGLHGFSLYTLLVYFLSNSIISITTAYYSAHVESKSLITFDRLLFRICHLYVILT